MKTPEDILEYSASYLQIIFLGILFTTLYNYFTNVLRSLGDSRSPFIFLLIASGVNIVLDYVLIRYTSLGVRGAAIATVFSQTISAILCFIKINRILPQLSLKGYRLYANLPLMAGNMRLGFPMGLQSSMIAMGVVFVQGAINRMGTASIAAYAAGSQIDGVGVEPMRSLGMALATFTAQNYGAGRYDRIIRGVRQIVWISLMMSGVLCLILCVFGRPIASLYVGNDQPLVLDRAARFLRIHGILYPFLALLFDWRFALQGLGISRVIRERTVQRIGLIILAGRRPACFLLRSWADI